MNDLICFRIAHKVIPAAVVGCNFYILFFAVCDELFKICNGKGAVFIIRKAVYIVAAGDINTSAKLCCRIDQAVFYCKLFLTDAVFIDSGTSPTSDGRYRKIILFAIFLCLLQCIQKFLHSVINIQFYEGQSFCFYPLKILFMDPANHPQCHIQFSFLFRNPPARPSNAAW